MSGSLQKNGDLRCYLSLLNKKLQTGLFCHKWQICIYFMFYNKRCTITHTDCSSQSDAKQALTFSASITYFIFCLCFWGVSCFLQGIISNVFSDVFCVIAF